MKTKEDASVKINKLVKTYTDDRGRPTFTAVKNISLDIKNGEFMVLVGPSGCGKSTCLRMVAGLEKITSGTISIGERVVNDLGAERSWNIDGIPKLCALSAHEFVQQHGFWA